MRRSCLNVGRANFLINLNIPKICYTSGEKTFAKYYWFLILYLPLTKHGHSLLCHKTVL
jgi:hypothetical protein